MRLSAAPHRPPPFLIQTFASVASTHTPTRSVKYNMIEVGFDLADFEGKSLNAFIEICANLQIFASKMHFFTIA